MKKMLLCLPLAFAAVAFAGKYDDWVKEETEVLITKQEKDAFKKLKSDAQKEEFIGQFWAKRDPSPTTPENEFKNEYEKRIQVVREKLQTSEQKPFESEIGQAFILLGQPAEQKMPELKEESTGKSSEPIHESKGQIWIYRDLPKEIAAGEIQIEFVPDPQAGGYKFADGKKSREILEKARNFYAQLADIAKKQPTLFGVAEPPVSSASLKAALDASAGGTPPQDVVFQSSADSFMTSAGESFVTLAIGSSADVVAARVGIRVLDASGGSVKEFELPFAKQDEKPGYFQTGMALPPGDYTLVLAVASGDKVGGMKQSLKIPEYSSKFSISSMILSNEMKQLTIAKPEKEPYTFGAYRFAPKLDKMFTQADQLFTVYEIYNFPVDEAGKPNLEETVRIQREQDRPMQTPPTVPQGLIIGKKLTVPGGYPLKDYAAGKYKYTLTLKNKATNETVNLETLFTIQ